MGAIVLLVTLFVISKKLEKINENEKLELSSVNDDFDEFCDVQDHEYCGFCDED